MSYWKERNKKKKEQGVCRICSLPTTNGTHCDKHQKEINLRNKLSRDRRRSSGICIWCKNSIDEKSKSFCKDCIDKQKTRSKKSKHKFNQIKRGASNRGIKFDINKKEFEQWYDQCDKKCHYCGITDILLADSNRKKSFLTIDRKNNNTHYTLSNVCIACHRCNNLKSNFFIENEWLEIANKFIKPRLAEYHCLEGKT